MPIPIGRKGRITNPGVSEPYILVEDDIENTGGYLILTSNNADFTSGFDGWASQNDLEQYIKESGYTIDWSQDETVVNLPLQETK